MTSRFPRGALAAVSVLTLLVVGLTGAVPAAASGVKSDGVHSAALPPTGAGIDLSFPQCTHASHVPLPPNIPFAVVGVNGGSANNSNPCFESQYNSALLLTGATDQPHVAVYVNTGNPALAGAWWPIGNDTKTGTAVVNPNGTCAGLAGAACAYVYGYSMAQADYRRVRDHTVVMPTLWWLDVETSNTWQPDLVANAASLSGMVDYFKSKYLDVGIYSTSYQWGRIAGAVPATSDLAGLPSWLAGGSFLGAPADCEKSPLTPNGRVAMIQYVWQFDNDYSCRRFAESTARIAPVPPPAAGDTLTAQTGQWAPGDVTYLYQWNQNGIAIPGATTQQYVIAPADNGTQITVTITGLASGYSAASQTSDPVAVLAPGTD